MDDYQLISLVQNYEFLYNKRLPDFKNLEKKRQAWRAISKKLNVSVELCTKRYTSLRDRYVRKYREYTKFGTAMGECNWHLYAMLAFLEPHINIRKSHGSVKGEETCVESELDEKHDVPTSSPTTFSEQKYTGNGSCSQFYNQFKSNESLSPNPLDESMSAGAIPETEQTLSTPVVRAFLEAVNCFKQVVEKEKYSRDAALDGFGHMIVATISEMSPAKQAIAISEVTGLVMNLKNEPDENYG